MFEKLVSPSSEADIIKYWKYTDQTYISVICTTYNQEMYIRDAIESFLAQECEYKFEIVIHDDVSLDRTKHIASTYQRKYPNIIRLVQPEKNLYSSVGMNYVLYNAMIHSDGKYVALCEGDDYWIDKNKLQNQISTILKGSAVGLVVSPGYIEDCSKNEYERKFFHLSSNCRYGASDILNFDGQFSPTASYFFEKKSLMNKFDIYKNCPIGDFYIELVLSELGIVSLDVPTCVYRYFSSNSWTNNELADINRKRKFIISHKESVKQVCDKLSLTSTPAFKYRVKLLDFELSKLYAIDGKLIMSIRSYLLNRCYSLGFYRFLVLLKLVFKSGFSWK